MAGGEGAAGSGGVFCALFWRSFDIKSSERTKMIPKKCCMPAVIRDAQLFEVSHLSLCFALEDAISDRGR